MTFGIISIILIALVQSLCIAEKENTMAPLSKEKKLNFTELGIKHGKTIEEHKVITEDDYILTIFHMLPAKKVSKSRPVLLLHGIIDSADSFIVRGNTSLAMKLSEKGYDVWVGNARGNKYSRSHKKINPDKDKKFWNFSFHESGYYDIPAMIDFVLNETGEKKLRAIAHSQGTTEFFVLGSTRPEYNEKISIMIALAPVAFLSNLEPPVSYLIQSASTINAICETMGIEEVLADHDFSKPIMEILCTSAPFRYELCVEGVIFAMGGIDRNQFEREFLPVIIRHVPCGTSRKSLMHLAQIAQSKRFAEFDYGPEGNSAKYQSLTPPNYDLVKNNMTVALFFGGNDGYSKVKDVKKLRKLLPNVVEYHKMYPNNWNHFDFVWGRYMDKYLYPHLFQVLQNYD